MIEFGASFAFQPIADISARKVFAYEALARGKNGESAASVFAAVPPDSLHAFDHAARLAAVRLAARLGLKGQISLNVMPGCIESMPDSIDLLLECATQSGLSPGQLLLEITEGEAVQRPKEFSQLLNRYRAKGVRLAIDDFGAGYSGLNLLAYFQPDLIKLDMHLVRDIDRAGPRQAIARAVLQVCDDLGIEVIAEGVETIGEYSWFRRVGVRLFQGYLLARPAFEALETPVFPDKTA
ncbi:MAG: EAL domain-containing protein [Steroidobacteraceae bacterium]|nr:EAL domain-containing protein [Steroidobacteraceae bacterium]